MQNLAALKSSRFAILLSSLLALLCILVPVALANDRKGLIEGFFVLVLLFFFPGYAFQSALGTPTDALRIFLSPIFGIATLVTVYDVAVRLSIGNSFPYFALLLSCTGVRLFARHCRRISLSEFWKPEDAEAFIAGCLVTLSVALLYWRSGRFSNGLFVFYGPAAQDPLFHLTLMQRLLHHLPTDNFIMVGLRAPVYHYFDDLTLALTLIAQRALHLGSTDIFDLYYRCYPTLVYFLLGALAYRVGRQLVGKIIGGILGALMLLGAGGLGWLLGALRTVSNAPHVA